MKKRMNKIIGLITKKKRKVVLLTIIFLMIFTSAFIYINLTNPTKINSYVASVINKGAPANKAFDDDVFYKVVVDAYNKENKTSLPYTTSLTDEQLKTITSIYYSGYNREDAEKIKSAKGIEKLTSLTSLDLEYNNLSNIDLGNNTALTFLKLTSNRLSSIDVSKNLSLTTLELSSNRLSSIDVSKNLSLTTLELTSNNLSNIDLGNNTALKTLRLALNNLSSIDLSKNTTLKTLYMSNNNLSNIDLGNNTALTTLELTSNNLSNIDLGNNTALKTLHLSSNRLSSINVSKNSSLTSLDLRNSNLSSIDVSKNTSLSFLGLTRNNLSSIDLSNNTALETLYLSSNNLSSIDLSKNTALTDLNLSRNNIKELNLSKNTALTSLNLYENPLTLGEYRLIKGTSVEGNGVGNVKLPEQFLITYEMEDGSIATYEEGLIKGLKSGTTNLKGTIKEAGQSGEDLIVEGTIKVFDIKSDKYDINKEDKYIYTKTDTDNSTIMKNIMVENGTGKIENNIFKVMDEDIVVEEYKIVSVSSIKYDLSKDYIYTGTNSLDKSKITCKNCELEEKNNNLNIKYNNEVLDSYKLSSYSSSVYDLSKEYIYLRTDTFDKTKINCINCTLEVNDNTLNIKYNGETLDSYKLLSYSSSVYDLSKEYIYVGTNSFSAGNIKLVNLTTMVNNNTLEIKYGSKVMESYKMVSVSSSKYDLSKDSIKLKEDDKFDLNSINVVNGAKEYKDNKLYIKYGNEVLKTYEITYLTTRLKGDVNNDNKITVIDVSMLYRHIKKRSTITDQETLLISDINNDGKITIMDVSLLYRYVKGKINEL